jgi:hypothetical protein
MVGSRHVAVRSRRDTVIEWLLIAAVAVILAAGGAGLIWFPIQHGAGLLERLLHLPVLLSRSVAVAVCSYGVRVLRRWSAPRGSSNDG